MLSTAAQMCTYIMYFVLGAVHKVRHHFFAIFDTPPCHVSTFVCPSVIIFPSIFDPSPLKKADALCGGPLYILYMRTCYKVYKATLSIVG